MCADEVWGLGVLAVHLFVVYGSLFGGDEQGYFERIAYAGTVIAVSVQSGVVAEDADF